MIKNKLVNENLNIFDKKKSEQFNSETIFGIQNAVNFPIANLNITDPPQITFNKAVYRRYYHFGASIVPIKLGIIKKNFMSINLSKLSVELKCHMLTNINLIFSNSETTIENIELTFDGERMDYINSKLLDIICLFKFNKNKSNSTLTIPFYFMNKENPLFMHLDQEIMLNIRTKHNSPNCNVKMCANMITSIESLSFDKQPDSIIQKWGSNYTSYYIGKNTITNDQEIILNFRGYITQIFISIEPQNKNSIYELYGCIMEDNRIVSFIDPIINEINVVEKYRIEQKVNNLYLIPFALNPDQSDLQPTGYKTCINNMSLKFTIKQKTQFDNEYVNMQIWGPSYEIYNIVNDKFIKIEK